MKIFIGDSLTGNDALDQAEKFNKEIGIDAIILTKMDADAKGGAALSISHVTNKPVIYVGVGQKYDDLKKFDREWFSITDSRLKDNPAHSRQKPKHSLRNS